MTIRDFLEFFKRHIVRHELDWTGLDWIGFVKEGIGLVKAKTPCIVLRILMELGSGTFESGFFWQISN